MSSFPNETFLWDEYGVARGGGGPLDTTHLPRSGLRDLLLRPARVAGTRRSTTRSVSTTAERSRSWRGSAAYLDASERRALAKLPVATGGARSDRPAAMRPGEAAQRSSPTSSAGKVVRTDPAGQRAAATRVRRRRGASTPRPCARRAGRCTGRCTRKLLISGATRTEAVLVTLARRSRCVERRARHTSCGRPIRHCHGAGGGFIAQSDRPRHRRRAKRFAERLRRSIRQRLRQRRASRSGLLRSTPATRARSRLGAAARAARVAPETVPRAAGEAPERARVRR